MNLLATAVMSPAGLKVAWVEHDAPTDLAAVDFVEELRSAAARTPHGDVQALVLNMSDRAAYAAGAVALVKIDSAGSLRCLPSDALAWDAATRPAPAPIQAELPGPPAPSAPSPATRDAAQIGGGLDLFSSSFTAADSGTAPTSLPEVTVVTANTKGGASKTTVAILTMLAAAHLAGHNDAALIDINPEGLLADHTVRTGVDDVIGLAKAASVPGFAQSPKDLTRFLNWQPDGWASVVCPHSIVSNDGGLITDLSQADVEAVIAAMRRAFSMLLLDTGNNAKDPAWQAAVAVADTILVPVQWDPDTMVRAQRMLNDMARVGHTRLKERVIFVGSSAVRPNRKQEKTYRAALERDNWRIMDLPFDRHVASKGVIEWSRLNGRTRTAATALVKAILA